MSYIDLDGFHYSVFAVFSLPLHVLFYKHKNLRWHILTVCFINTKIRDDFYRFFITNLTEDRL